MVLVANKAEGKHGEVGAMESYALGLGDPVQISAEHGEGMSDLYDALRVLMPEPVEEGEEFDDDDIIEQSEEELATRPIRVAIVGRPNAGKSTLINHLLGEERLSDQRGSRHDAGFHLRRDQLAGPGFSRVRYRRPPAALADRGKARKTVRCRRAARHPLRRSRRA